jgi:hypothetical protein
MMLHLSLTHSEYFKGDIDLMQNFDDDAGRRKQNKKDSKKTYNRRDSQMVTHSSTSRPVQCLCMAERTGCPVFTDLWSYVLCLATALTIAIGIKG